MSAPTKTLISCIFGPRLYSFYKLTGNTLSSRTPDVLSRTHQYEPNSTELISDTFIRVTGVIFWVGAYISPAILTYILFRKNSPDSLLASIDNRIMLQLMATIATGYISSYIIRGFGRSKNPEYLTFLQVLEESHTKLTSSNKRILAHFDSDFSAFPFDYKWSDAKDVRKPSPYESTFPESSKSQLILDNSLLKYPLELILTIVMQTIGRRLIYPGSLSLFQGLLGQAISAGRLRLIDEYDGIRYKLQSFGGDSIDSMFIDRRGSTPNGDTLVIGCEGNGGFYELGTILTPLEGGYSVLGWNHPGFGGSTGIPYPSQEVAAIDTVIKFATDKLGFQPKKILLYGWSIGGFTATWGAMRHPDVSGVVVDATFDHILPLARKLFPEFMYPIVEMAVKRHFDLDNTRHMRHYKGPVLLIRRSQDEVISTNPFNSPPTNRANYLLIDIMQDRFPKLMDTRGMTLMREFLEGNARYQEGVLKRYSVNSTQCLRLLSIYFRENPISYPVDIGPELDNVTKDQLVLFLASKFIIDYDSVHCEPLPPRYFQKPWDLIGSALKSNL